MGLFRAPSKCYTLGLGLQTPTHPTSMFPELQPAFPSPHFPSQQVLLLQQQKCHKYSVGPQHVAGNVPCPCSVRPRSLSPLSQALPPALALPSPALPLPWLHCAAFPYSWFQDWVRPADVLPCEDSEARIGAGGGRRHHHPVRPCPCLCPAHLFVCDALFMCGVCMQHHHPACHRPLFVCVHVVCGGCRPLCLPYGSSLLLCCCWRCCAGSYPDTPFTGVENCGLNFGKGDLTIVSYVDSDTRPTIMNHTQWSCGSEYSIPLTSGSLTVCPPANAGSGGAAAFCGIVFQGGGLEVQGVDLTLRGLQFSGCR